MSGIDRATARQNIIEKQQVLFRDKPENWELEFATLETALQSIEAEIPKTEDPGLSINNLGRAALNRLPTSFARAADAVGDLANFIVGPKEQVDEQGYALRDPITNRPLPPQRRFDFGLEEKVGEFGLPTSIDLLGEQNANIALGIDLSMDNAVLAFPVGKSINMSAATLAKLPGTKRLTDPFRHFDLVDEIFYGSASGFGAGYFSADGETPNLAAEILTPLGISVGASGVYKQVLARLFPKYRSSDLSEEMAFTLLNNALAQSGLTIDEAVERYTRLGAEGLLTDVDDQFRNITREARSQGVMTGSDTRALSSRIDGDMADLANTGRTGRLNADIGRTLGTMDGNTYIRTIQQEQSGRINKLYEDARLSNTGAIPDEVMDVLNLPGDMQTAIAAAERNQRNRLGSLALTEGKEGADLFEHNFDYINAIKQALDDQIARKTSALNPNASERNAISGLITLRNNLVKQADEAYPGFADARNAFAGVAELKDLVERGRNIFNRNWDIGLLDEAATTYGTSERNAFRIGARDALLETISMSQNPARQLTRNPEVIERLKTVFDQDELDNFLNAIEREGEFLRTRNQIMGGSQSFDKYMASQNMHQNVAALMFSATNPLGQYQAFAGIIEKLARNQSEDAYKQGLILANDVLLNSNLSPQAVREALTSGNVRQLVAPIALSIWGKEQLPQSIKGALRGTTISEVSQLANREMLAQEQAVVDRANEERVNDLLTNRL